MAKYTKLANEIIKNVGGEKNISSLTHCITRLRFKLNDESIANDDAIKSLNGVVTLIKSGGQYQVVIGNNVAEVYAEIANIINIADTNSNTESKGNIFNKIIDIISGIFQPILGVMSACGMIKGFNALFIALGLYNNSNGISVLLDGIGDSLFMFLPIFLGYTSAQKFNLKPMIGLAIGASMCYPLLQLSQLSKIAKPIYTLFQNTIFQSDVYIDLFGIPIISMDYTSTVIPVIFVVYFASKCEKFFNKIIPDLIKFFFVPMLVLLVSIPVGFLLLGPITIFSSMIISEFVFNIRNISPLIAGAIVGGTWQILVIFGMHWGFIPIYINNLVTLGYDNIMMPFFACTFATAGVLLAIFFMTKDKKMREIVLPNFISSIFGVTEPAIYGITLPMKKPFIVSCIVGAIVGGFYGHFNFRKFFAGGMGVFEFPAMINPDGSNGNIIVAISGALLALILGFVITLFTCKKQITNNNNTENENNKINNETNKSLLKRESITSPLKGIVKQLRECSDEAFASESLGKGVVIIPDDGKVISPINGVVSTIIPTLHAIGITSDSGIELLIHVGINTVNLNGKHFIKKCNEGDNIKIGDCILEFDRDAIIKEGYSIETPIIIINTDDFLDVLETYESDIVDYNSKLIDIIR